MALKKTKTFKQVEITDAYNRIHEVIINKSEGGFVLVFSVAMMANSNAPSLCVQQEDDYRVAYDLESADNALKQAYAHLKTLPEFDGSTDV